MNFQNRLFVYCLIVLIPFFYRWNWNDKSVFVSSDPQIKYYQVINSLAGNPAETCYFPAAKLGFPIQMIPIGYPWAFFLNDGKCVFQYPTLFIWIQTYFSYIFTKVSISYFPILFFFFNFLLLDRILILFEKKGFVVGLTVIIIQCFSPVFLSSLDYSELTLTNFFFLLSIFSFLRFVSGYRLVFGILLSLGIVFNFQLRPESSIALLFFLIVSFLYSQNKKELLLRLAPFVFLSLIVQVIFSVWNYNVYGHFLGMRGLNTVNDMGSDQMQRQYFAEWIADLWGNDFKIGIFKGYPLLFLVGFSLFKEKNSPLLPFIYAGLVFVLLLPILSPYRAGVGIFGMRYYESGVYLILIGALLSFWKYTPKYLALLIFIPILYFSYKSDTKATKQWTSASILYHEVLNEFNRVKPDIIVHRGLSLSYLMGTSYMDYPQVVTYSNDDWLKIEKILSGKSNRVLFLQWEGNQLVNNEFPSSVWKEKFDINFIIQPKLYKITDKFKIAHFQGFLLENKK